MRTNTPHSPAKQGRHPAIFVPFHLPWDRPADYQRQTYLELAKTYPVFCVAENEPISLKAAFQLILHPTKHQAVLNQISSNKQQHLYWCRPIHFLPLQRWRSIKSLNLVFNIVLINLWWKWFSSKLEPSSRLQVKPEKIIIFLVGKFFGFLIPNLLLYLSGLKTGRVCTIVLIFTLRQHHLIYRLKSPSGKHS